MGWRSSLLRKILLPSFKDILGAKVIGDFIATSYTDALLISFRYFLEFLKEPVFFIFNLNLIIYGYFLVL